MERRSTRIKRGLLQQKNGGFVPECNSTQIEDLGWHKGDENGNKR